MDPLGCGRGPPVRSAGRAEPPRRSSTPSWRTRGCGHPGPPPGSAPSCASRARPLAPRCLGGVRHSQTPWLADPWERLSRLEAPAPGHRTHAAPSRSSAPRCGAAMRPGMLGCVLHREAQRGRESLTRDGVRCSLFVRDRDARAAGHPRHGHRAPAHARGAHLSPRGPSCPRLPLDRWGTGVLRELPDRVSRTGHRASPPRGPACADDV